MGGPTTARATIHFRGVAHQGYEPDADSEYVREPYDPTDNVAIFVRNRSTGHTVQTIAKAETIANPDFQRWLSHQSASGYDIYVGMNPSNTALTPGLRVTSGTSGMSISTSTETPGLSNQLGDNRCLSSLRPQQIKGWEALTASEET